MKTFHLRRYILLSIVVHLLVLWLLSLLPPYEPRLDAPVAIRMLNPPPLTDLQSLPPAPNPITPKRQPLKKTPPPPPQEKGGILAELPKPLRQERPKDARLVSKYDSKAQDIGARSSRAQKPSGQTPRLLPPELALPERYSQLRPKAPQQTTITPPPPLHKKGGILTELPKTLREEQPKDEPLVSKYDSKVQDIGARSSRAQKSSGQTPRLLPPELALPERYSQLRPKGPPQTTTTPPPPLHSPSLDNPPLQLQARRLPMPRPDNKPKETRQSTISKEALPDPIRDKHMPLLAPTPELRQFDITDQQELSMVQRDQPFPEQRQTTSSEQNP